MSFDMAQELVDFARKKESEGLLGYSILKLVDEVSVVKPISFCFNSGNLGKLYGVDGFSGRKFLYITSNYPKEIRIFPTVILDSNLVSYLQGFVESKLDKEFYYPIFNFIKEIHVDLNYDFNPIFYFFESYYKQKIEKFERFARDAYVALLKIQVMNNEEFVRSYKIQEDPALVARLCASKGCSSLEEVAQKHVSNFINTSVSDGDLMPKVTYLILLKMVLVKYDQRVIKGKKLQAIYDYMIKEFGLFCIREFVLSALYFSSKSSGAIKCFEKNINIEKLKHNLQATAWDIFFVRMPEMLLSISSPNDITVATICTGEEFIKDICEMISYDRIDTCNGSDIFQIHLRIDYNLLKEKVDIFYYYDAMRIIESHVSGAMGEVKLTKEKLEDLEKSLLEECAIFKGN